jgi:hypothetical protein
VQAHQKQQESRMKKTLAICTAAAAFAAISFAQEDSNTVSSANIVGYSQVALEPGGKYTLASCNFQTGETNTLLSIFGTNQLTQSDSLLNCDRVFLYDSVSQTYQAWAQWTDGVFYKANNLTEWNAEISGDPEVPVGTGFFISSGNVSNTLYLSGDVVMVETQNVEIAEGYQILGYGFSSDINLQETAFSESGAAADNNMLNCDRVHAWEGDRYQAYALWTNGVWYKANNLDEWNAEIPATNQLALSQGFFYEAQNPITWTETNKYLSALQN